MPALVFIATASDGAYLADFWHHLARGRAIVDQGQMVDTDLFTFTVPGQQFRDVNWLSQITYFLLFQYGGLDLIRIVNAIVLALALAWLVVVCRRNSGSLVIAAGAGILVFFGLWQVLTIRPQTFSLLLFIGLYDLLDRAERNPWFLAAAPAILALWANLHGAFPAGIMLIGCFTLAKIWEGFRKKNLFRSPATWQLGICLSISLAATLVNPYGWRIYEYVGATSEIAAARRIDEWVPPNLDLWIGKAWLASLVITIGITTVGWVKVRYRPTVRDLLLVGCFLPLACGSVRMVVWWLLIWAPHVVSALGKLLPKSSQNKQEIPEWGAVAACSLLGIAALFSLPGLTQWNPLLCARQTQPRVEDHLETCRGQLAGRLPNGRIFSRFEWGEYLTWSYSPEYKVFMDGRIEIYPDKVWQDYSAVTCGLPGWETILDSYGVDALILDRSYHNRTGLLSRVAESSGWREVFASGPAALYVRQRHLVHLPPQADVTAAP